jgi:hypothetical protein
MTSCVRANLAIVGRAVPALLRLLRADPRLAAVVSAGAVHDALLSRSAVDRGRCRSATR